MSGERVAAEQAGAGNSAAPGTHYRRPPSGKKAKNLPCPHLVRAASRLKDIAIFFRQFSVMIDAGLPSCSVLKFSAPTRRTRLPEDSHGVRTTVEGGATLANAMRLYPKVSSTISPRT